MVREIMTIERAVKEARALQADGKYINGTVFHMLADALTAERAKVAALVAREARLVDALKWAFPLARIAQDDHRQRRNMARHDDILGTRRDGTMIVGLWQKEIDAEERADDAITTDGTALAAAIEWVLNAPPTERRMAINALRRAWTAANGN